MDLSDEEDASPKKKRRDDSPTAVSDSDSLKVRLWGVLNQFNFAIDFNMTHITCSHFFLLYP